MLLSTQIEQHEGSGIYLDTENDMAIDTGDHVEHAPSGETWVVAFVDGDHLYWCGWPEGRAQLSDCKLVKKATAAERHNLLIDMAKGQGFRASYAARVLEQI